MVHEFLVWSRSLIYYLISISFSSFLEYPILRLAHCPMRIQWAFDVKYFSMSFSSVYTPVASASAAARSKTLRSSVWFKIVLFLILYANGWILLLISVVVVVMFPWRPF
jgi:hypothetical protein